MKKTLTVNLGGTVFHIDEDAYEALGNYLSQLEKRFASGEESREILTDVETRIGEIFTERLGASRQVVGMEDVTYAIGVMGKPEDFGEEQEQKESAGEGRKGRRIYRDPDNRILGGVGSGLAAYFDIDVVLVRIALVCTFFMSGPLIYLILWIVIPEARTTAQKLDMRGEPINVSNIEKNIRSEFQKVKNNFKERRTSDEARNIFERIGHIILQILVVFSKVFIILLGVFLIVLALGLMFGFTGSFFVDGWGVHGIGLVQFMELFLDPGLVFFSTIGLILLVGIPLVSMLYGGIKLIFGIRRSFRAIRITMLVGWLMGLMITAYSLLSGMAGLRQEGETKNVVVPDSVKAEVVVIRSWNDGCALYDDEVLQTGNWNVAINDDSLCVCGVTRLSVSATDSSYDMELIRRARHESRKEAWEEASISPMPAQWQDSVILVRSCFGIGLNKRFRMQEAEVNIHLPAGTKVVFEKGLEESIDPDICPENISVYDMPEIIWIVTRKGLVRAD